MARPFYTPQTASVECDLFAPGAEMPILPSNLQRPMSGVDSEIASRPGRSILGFDKVGSRSRLQKELYGQVEEEFTGRSLTGMCRRYIGRRWKSLFNDDDHDGSAR